MRAIAIIPARGGSKRLPRKNIKIFNEYPLIYYTIKAAKNSILISDVFVSTDDNEIAEVSIKYGAKVIARPTEISSDLATSNSVLVHAVEFLDENSISSDYVLTLQVTNPLRRKGLIDKAIFEFEKNGKQADSLMSVTQNVRKLGRIENGSFAPVTYELGQRSQDLNKLYYENGLIYITKTDVLRRKGSIFGDSIFPFILEDGFSEIDIDTIEDFEIAEIIYKKHKTEFEF